MTHGRIETTPEQQLAELRVAYTRYTTLAEQWRDDALTDPDERQAREQDARRIAHAYEKTIASTALRLESMHRTHAEALGFTPLAKTLSVMLGVAVISGGAATVYLRPELFRDVMPRAREVAVNAPAAKPEMPPIAKPIIAPVIPPVAKPVIAPAASPRRSGSTSGEARDHTGGGANQSQARALAKTDRPAATDCRKASDRKASGRKAASRKADARARKSRNAFPARENETRATQVSALPRVAVTPPVAGPSPQAKLEPLSPPKDIASLPVPPKIDAANSNVVTLPKSSETAAAAPQTAAAQASASAPSSTQTAKLVPVARTHLLPPYPADAKRAGEQGTTQMQVTISTEGVITDCNVMSSSGSQRLDAIACSYVQRNWRWQPPTRDGREVSATTKISVIWNLIAGR